MAKFIVIEGSSGSGKQVQATLLTQYFKNLGYKAIMMSFPNYDNEGCTPVKMYFSGALGSNAFDMDAYQSSVLFAVDRLTTFKSINLEEFDFIVLDRYTQSNFIYQAAKIDDEKALNEYIKYWSDFEFNKLKLPKADVVIYINMPYEMSEKLTNNKQLKFAESNDLEEMNEELERKSRETGLAVAKKLNWKIINCCRNEEMVPKEEIHTEIVNLVLDNLNKPDRRRRKSHRKEK